MLTLAVRLAAPARPQNSHRNTTPETPRALVREITAYLILRSALESPLLAIDCPLASSTTKLVVRSGHVSFSVADQSSIRPRNKRNGLRGFVSNGALSTKLFRLFLFRRKITNF